MIDFTKSNKWKSLKDWRQHDYATKELCKYLELMEKQLIALEAVVYALKKDVEANNASTPTVANIWNPGDRFYSDLYEGYGTVVSFVHAYDELPSPVWVQFDRDKDECGKFSMVPSDKIRKLTLEEELKEKEEENASSSDT